MKAPTQLMSDSPTDDDLDALILNGGGYVDRRDEFAEYMWMEDMESFDKQVMAELEEEEEIERCMAEMLAEEEARDTTYYNQMDEIGGLNDDCHVQRPLDELAENLGHLLVQDNPNPEDILRRTTLNPCAEEFVPSKNTDGICSDQADSSEDR